MTASQQVIEAIAGMTLFADLSGAQREGVAQRFEERYFAEGERILRQGVSGSALHVIVQGEASVVVDGEARATLGPGEFFGEVSVLLGELPTADVVAMRPLRCLVLDGPAVEAFLVEHPRVMYRMLQAMSRRLRNANRWRS